MKQWHTELTSGNEKLCKIDIKRGIFQGDSLSPLLFVMCMMPLSTLLKKEKAGYDLGKNRGKINHLLYMDDLKLYARNKKETDALISTTQIYSKDICMEFGISKCAHIMLQRGKVVSEGGLEILDGQCIDEVDGETGYKYLGILEANDIKHEQMKDKITKEYVKRVKKIASSKLNSGNTIDAINSRAVSLVRYGAGIIDWTKEELRKIDRKTRKILTMNRMLHPQSDVDRLYIPRKEGGRGLLGVEDCVQIEVESLAKYVSASDELLLQAVSKEHLITRQTCDQDTKKTRREERHKRWREKSLHGKLIREIDDIKDESSWDWIRKGSLKKETEGMIFAAQEQALRTNWIKKHIDKQDIGDKCRMCGEREESVSHLIAECKKLAQRDYKNRHDNIAKIIHLELCERYDLAQGVKWYNHQPESVIENESVRILWDFNIQTDHYIEHRRPDILVFEKDSRRCFIIDIASPGDKRVVEKEQEKIEHYSDLKRELKKIWKCSHIEIVPIIVGALGIVSKNLEGWMKKISLKSSTAQLQKATLLGTARILRKTLET